MKVWGAGQYYGPDKTTTFRRIYVPSRAGTTAAASSFQELPELQTFQWNALIFKPWQLIQYFSNHRPNKTLLWTGCSPQAPVSKLKFIGTGMFSLEKKNLRRDTVTSSTSRKAVWKTLRTSICLCPEDRTSLKARCGGKQNCAP